MTNSFFRKFSANFNYVDNISLFKGENSFNFVAGETAISYNKISDPIRLVRNVFPNKIFKIEPHLIYYTEVPGPGLLNPHRDHGVTTVANFYFDSNDAVTTFYKVKGEAKGINYSGAAAVQNDNIYDLNNLEEACSFKANNGDCYLLNVREIHSVYTENPGRRKFINMQWYGVDIDTVYASIIN